MARDQDLRFRRTNQMLCDAFTELLSQKKFEDITINELCEKALIRRATFYTHFLDKYDFFAYFIRQNRDSFVRTCPIEGEARNIRSFSSYMFQQLIYYLSEHMAMVHNVMNSNAFSILLDILAEEIRNSYRVELQRYMNANPSDTSNNPQNGDWNNVTNTNNNLNGEQSKESTGRIPGIDMMNGATRETSSVTRNRENNESGVAAEVASAYHAGGIIHLLRYWLTHAGSMPEEEIVRQYEALVKDIWG